MWRHDHESTWAARIRVCCWLLFLMLVKVCVCRARSAAKAWLSALVDGLRSVSGSPLTSRQVCGQLTRPRLCLRLSSDRTLRRE